jgi:hypothetical protein
MLHLETPPAHHIRARSPRKPRRSFGPDLEFLENRLVLHGAGAGVAGHHAARVHDAVASRHVFAQATSAETQVLNIISATYSSYGSLQAQLDSLATRLQHQTTSARRGTASHAQKLVQKFVKLENKRYKPIIALGPTVAGDTAAAALVQFEQNLHQTVLTVKTQVLPQFRLLVNATFVSGAPQSRLTKAAAASSSSTTGPAAHTSAVHLADQSKDEAQGVMFSFTLLLYALIAPLNNVASAPDTSCAWVASHSLNAYAHLLDVIEVFYHALSSSLSEETDNTFVGIYNKVVGAYNAAVTRTNAILASNQIITH